MSRPPVIGLAGRMRSGKTTVATYLEGACGYRRVSFGDSLRAAVATLDPIVAWSAWGPRHYCDVLETHGYEAAKAQFPEVRRLLQLLGTDVVRAMDPDAWCRAWMTQVAAGLGPVVADDVRFPNEVEHVRRLGGEVWWVERAGCLTGEHPSEHAIGPGDCDHVVGNDGTLADLHRLIEAHLV